MLTDENCCLIPSEDYVEQFFRERAPSAQPLVLLKLKNLHQKTMSTAQEESTKLKSEKLHGGKKGDYIKIELKDEIDMYAEFFKRFPGLSYYINQESIKEDVPKRQVKGLLLDDYNVCIMLLILILFFIFIAIFST